MLTFTKVSNAYKTMPPVNHFKENSSICVILRNVLVDCTVNGGRETMYTLLSIRLPELHVSLPRFLFIFIIILFFQNGYFSNTCNPYVLTALYANFDVHYFMQLYMSYI